MLYEKFKLALETHPQATVVNEQICSLLRPGFLGTVAQEITIAAVLKKPSATLLRDSECNNILAEIANQFPNCQCRQSTVLKGDTPHENELCFGHLKLYEIVGTIKSKILFDFNTSLTDSPPILPDGWTSKYECTGETEQLRRLITLWIYPSLEVERYVRSLGPYTSSFRVKIICLYEALRHRFATK
jgi:hypothetical protein